MAYSTLYELKRHLNIEQDYNDDDAYLQDLILVTELAINNYLNYSGSTMNETTVPLTIKQASLLLAAHFYTNRQLVSFAKAEEIPFSFRFLLDPYKNYIVC